MFNKTAEASIALTELGLVQHETSARPPYRVPTTLNISAEILDFYTSEHSRLKSSQLLLQYNSCQKHKSVGTPKRLFRILRQY